MINTLIIDDEQHCIDALLKLTSKYSDVFNVVKTCTNVTNAVETTNALNPDLVFLDVEINNQTGFEYLQQVKHLNFMVVFTTAYSKYAVKAFKFAALHYLLKPIDFDDFDEVVNRLKSQKTTEDVNKKIDTLLYNLKEDTTKKRISINTANECVVLNVSNIIYCEAKVNYTDIYIDNGKKITSSKTLKRFEEILLESGFYRVSQSCLVNLSHVKKYTKTKPPYAVMSNAVKVKVSLSSKEGFLKQLLNL
ncbi:response regulator transcription factor [Seonamhaeicola algicola]|uniref:Response regulator transcription factor n=1 Tax=Seonamhaeicola algicola TaxID=1719036 RepID=A0A5C7AX90_9FLAO|nr:LytTR family DNA-binding domain-containing protein [Seonamhaeicola algicola]TXE12787.1 response regulator transcription factor [Seonamhaeicola algicola]